MYIVNSGSVFNFCTLEMVFLIANHKAARLAYDPEAHHDIGNLRTI